jgi:4-amino-4-deoxy-L-arabinose transferase-like glycosyltransferase
VSASSLGSPETLRLAETTEAPEIEDRRRPSAADLDRKDPHVRFLLLLLGIGIVAFWLPRLPGSFWVDETTTAWTVDASFGRMIDRVLEFQSMAPTYFVVAWLAHLVGGTNEIALRIPSLVSMVAATYLLYRLGRRLFDAETGLIAAIVLATWNSGAHLATDARPYALGVLAFIGATLCLVRWLDDHRARDLVGYVVLAALVVYVHEVLAPSLLAHAVYVWMRRRDVPVRQAVLGAAAFALLLLPLVPIVLDTLGNRGALDLGIPGPGAVLLTVLPPAILVALAAGLAAVAGRVRADPDAPRAGRAELGLLVVWAVATPIGLYVVSLAIGAGVLGAQRVNQSAPAIALLAAYAIRRLDPAQARRIVVVVMVIVSVLLGATARQYTDDWRGAMRYASDLASDPSTPVLVRSGLVQASEVDWLTDPARSPITIAPAEVYLTTGTPVPLPFGVTASERSYLEREIVPIAESVSRFPVVTWSVEDPVLPWLEGRLRAEGFEVRELRRFGSVVVALFERA